MTDYCGRFMPVPETYNGTEMFTCMVDECQTTLKTKADFLECDGCRRTEGSK